MTEMIFKGVFDNELITTVTLGEFLLCVGTSLLIGLILCVMMLWRTKTSMGFTITLATLPTVVCVVIMMVNGNVGTGVAVAGAFSLVRFRSTPGSAKEIGAIFVAMGVGLMAGMGYLGYAALFTLVMGIVTMVYHGIGFGKRNRYCLCKTLHITIPEDLNYTDVFDSVFQQYATSSKLKQVKTTNMGSLFKLTYDLTLKNMNHERDLINALRQRNGNLEISICQQETDITGL